MNKQSINKKGQLAEDAVINIALWILFIVIASIAVYLIIKRLPA